jgi:hypothetical protein
MDDYTIFTYLCAYDSRNPHFDMPTDDWEEQELKERLARPECYCDNCFYGRTKLALEIIRLKSV